MPRDDSAAALLHFYANQINVHIMRALPYIAKIVQRYIPFQRNFEMQRARVQQREKKYSGAQDMAVVNVHYMHILYEQIIKFINFHNRPETRCTF